MRYGMRMVILSAELVKHFIYWGHDLNDTSQITANSHTIGISKMIYCFKILSTCPKRTLSPWRPFHSWRLEVLTP